MSYIKISEEKLKKLEELAQKKLSNWQLSIEMEAKLSTIQLWKRILRKRGIELPILRKPKKGEINHIIGKEI